MKTVLSPDQLRQWYWEEQRSVPTIAKTLGVSRHAVYDLMRKHQIARRSLTESNYIVSKRKPQFSVKLALSVDDEKLKVAGIMLYWAEGAHTGSGVDFANSNPEMIALFLRFLREICGTSELRLRVYMYHHGDTQQVEAAKHFWREVTKIPLAQFSKPYIRRGNPHYSGRIMLHGLVHIRYMDKRLLELIQRWIVEYRSVVNGAGTKAANWGGL